MRSLEELIYEFDIRGYVIIEDSITDDALDRLNRFWSTKLSTSHLHDVDFSWGKDWSGLIDNDRVFKFLSSIYNMFFRLDHIFCFDERFTSSSGRLHHGSDMFESGIYYDARNGKIHNGLTAVQYAISDTGERSSHFCCVPGSHRANFSTPEVYRSARDCPFLDHVYLKAGSALIFSEALVHGTFAVDSSTVRRGVLARYTNSYAYFRRPPDHTCNEYLPETPNHSTKGPIRVDKNQLTDRQNRIVTEPAYSRGKSSLV